MQVISLIAIAATAATLALPPANCAWEERSREPRCAQPSYSWGGRYPACTAYQHADHTPIPCQGVEANYCEFKGQYANSTPPQPASWHVHVFFPNQACGNCSAAFRNETAGYSYPGAMDLRSQIAAQLNVLANDILKLRNQTLRDPIDSLRAGSDPAYNQCGDDYNIVAGAPANFHAEPCVFEVDAVKKQGPFTDPLTGDGYPNYSFLIPSQTWLPGLLERVQRWLTSKRGEYDVLIHPNTGCEVRDHVEEQSIYWMGRSYQLLPQVFGCNALGCNQACPEPPPATVLPAPADCPVASR